MGQERFWFPVAVLRRPNLSTARKRNAGHHHAQRWRYRSVFDLSKGLSCLRMAQAFFLRRLFWTAAVYSVQIIVGPIMLPLLQVLLEVFACARDEDGVLRLERDNSIICNSRSHLALLIPAAIFLVILIYISFRLNRVDNDLGATEIRWKNIFDFRGDLVRYSHIAHSWQALPYVYTYILFLKWCIIALSLPFCNVLVVYIDFFLIH